MVVLSNRRLGPRAELLVSDEVARAILLATAASARPVAQARWEVELVRWLETRGGAGGSVLDVSEIAWTPDHFDAQRRFLVEAITRAAQDCQHAAALALWRHLVEGHPRDSVQVGRLWQWSATT